MSISLLGYGFYTESEIQQLKDQYQQALKDKESWKKGYGELKNSPVMRENEQHVKTIESQKKEIITLQQFKIQSIQQAEIIRDLHIKEESLIKELTKSKEETNATKIELNEEKKKTETLMNLDKWVFVCGNDEEIGYSRVNANGARLDLIRVKKNIVKEMPLDTKDGEDIYQDGSHYPASLMDIIRKNNIPNSGIKEEAVKLLGNNQNNFLEPDNENDGSEAVEEQTDKTDNETDDEEPQGLTPNQNRVYSFVKLNPGLPFTPIAEQLNIDRGNLSRLLKSLDEMQIIRRDENDRFFVASP